MMSDVVPFLWFLDREFMCQLSPPFEGTFCSAQTCCFLLKFVWNEMGALLMRISP